MSDLKQNHKRLFIVTLLFFGAAFISFIIGVRNNWVQFFGIAFVCLSVGATFGIITNWLYVGEATVRFRSGGGSNTRINNKGGPPTATTTSNNQGAVISQKTYTKGDSGYYWAVAGFGGAILIFFVVGILLIMFGEKLT